MHIIYIYIWCIYIAIDRIRPQPCDRWLHCDKDRFQGADVVDVRTGTFMRIQINKKQDKKKKNIRYVIKRWKIGKTMSDPGLPCRITFIGLQIIGFIPPVVPSILTDSIYFLIPFQYSSAAERGLTKCVFAIRNIVESSGNRYFFFNRKINLTDIRLEEMFVSKIL